MNNNKGITLIALVITIIILVILAAISINLVLNNGLVLKTGNSTRLHGLEEEKERLELLKGDVASDESHVGIVTVEYYVQELIKRGMTTEDKVTDNGDGSKTVVTDRGYKAIISPRGEKDVEIVVEGEKVATKPEQPTMPPVVDDRPLINTIITTEHETIVAKDNKGNKVVIPGGFKIAEDSGTTVQEGVVIEDNEENQFVWIPVSNINHDGTNKIVKSNGGEIEITLGRYQFDTSTGEETVIQYANTYETPVRYNSYYSELVISRETSSSYENTTARDLGGFVSSVRDNGGFYFARFEASKGEVLEPYQVAYEYPVNNLPVSKKDSMNWGKVNQAVAARASRIMYDDTWDVVSDLVNSYMWDTAILYIQAMGNENYANARRSLESRVKAGESGDEVCKIFDMAGGATEWTTEYCSQGGNRPCVQRGGRFNDAGSQRVSTRSCFTVPQDESYSGRNIWDFGFRVGLYIKTWEI